MAYLMTHSLLAAWLRTMKGNPYEDATTESDPMAEFLTVLRRERTETTEAMQRGIDFENLVTAIIECEVAPTGLRMVPDRLKENDWYPAAEKVANIVQGGPLQYKASKRITVSGIDIVLYGRLDSLKAGVVRDIKFSRSYDRGKYFDSTQHPVYLEIVPEAYAFEYVVSNGTDVWVERYERYETPSIIPIISNFLDWLRATGYMDIYLEHWKSA